MAALRRARAADERVFQHLRDGCGGDVAAGRRTLERIFEVDVGLAAPAARVLPFGQRVHVRFAHPPTALATQGWHALRRLFLRHFDV